MIGGRRRSIISWIVSSSDMLLSSDLFNPRPFHLDSKAVTLSKGDAGIGKSEKGYIQTEVCLYKMLQTSVFVHITL